MATESPRFEATHLLGERATRPNEPPWGGPGALHLHAGRSPPRRLAFPGHPMTAHSGASNCRIKAESTSQG